MPQDAEELSAESVGYVRFVDHLARRNSEALSYIPRPKLEFYATRGQILMETENDDWCGFLIHGSGSRVMKIYQACVQHDARRWKHGLALVERLKAKAVAFGCHALMVRCAADLDSNAFWVAAGFELVAVVPGGERRGRLINVYRCALDVPCLFVT